MNTVTIGMIGGGFAARLHGDALKQVGEVGFRLRSVADVNLCAAQTVAELYGYETYTSDYNDILSDPEIQVVIICTPPVTHANIIIQAMEAGKHVICEKPLTGYFGEENELGLIGNTVSRERMLAKVNESLDEIQAVMKRTGRKLFYAENFVYAPSVQKAADIIRKKNSRITFMRSECSVSRSPSKNAGLWSNMGGGSLIRIGCHPLATVLYLKQVEAETMNKEISVVSVVADVGQITPGLPPEHRKHVTGAPIDVEDISVLSLTFSDGSKGLVMTNDNVLGGLVNYVNVYTTDSTMICNTIPTTGMQTYFVEDQSMDDIYISENLNCKLGWNNVFVSESIERGYVAQLKDFLECIVYDRDPIVGFELASRTIRIIYQAYVSASTGQKVMCN